MNVTIYDPTTGSTKSISIDMYAAMVIQDADADMDFYILMKTAARDKDGNVIGTRVIRNLFDGAGENGTVQLDGSDLPYSNLTAAIADHIRRMVEGDLVDPDTAMAFS